MALVVGTNTWVTEAIADSYLEGKLGADAWDSLPSATKEKCLISAYRWINRVADYSIATVTQKLKDAQCELAWWLYNNYKTWEKHEAVAASGVTQFRISKFWENIEKAGLPQTVKDLLDEYLYNGGGYFPTIEREVDDNG